MSNSRRHRTDKQLGRDSAGSGNRTLVIAPVFTIADPPTVNCSACAVCIDNSYTSNYASCIYCVCTKRRKPCAMPPLTYEHCPSNET